MRRAATPCLLPEMLIIDTSDSKPDPAQSLYRVAELDLEGCVKPILQSEIRFRKAGRTSRERIERVCPPQQVRKFCAGTQKMTNQASFPLCTKAQGYYLPQTPVNPDVRVVAQIGTAHNPGVYNCVYRNISIDERTICLRDRIPEGNAPLPFTVCWGRPS